MKRLIFTIPLLILSTFVIAQDLTLFEEAKFSHRKDTLPYRILFPEGYDTTKTYPLLFVLHGAGERGNDNQAQLTHGGKLFVDPSVRNSFQAIVVFPQCPADSYWSNVNIVNNADGSRTFNFKKGGKPTRAMRTVLKLIDEVANNEAVAGDQIYIGGLSMGGMGTLEVLRRKKNTFAAAFAICGGDNTENAKKYRNTPLWFFHGELDDVVPSSHSRELIEALEKLGTKPKYTFYPEANHNSWDPTFAEPELLPWLLSHTLN